MVSKLKKQMKDYYVMLDEPSSEAYKHKSEIINSVLQLVNKRITDDPDIDVAAVESEVFALIADSFEPVIFSECPFFFEMGIKKAQSWYYGAPWQIARTIILNHKLSRNSMYGYIEPLFRQMHVQDKNSLNLFVVPTCFDDDHHTIGYTKLFAVGIDGLKKEIQQSLSAFSAQSEECKYLSSMHSCLDSIIRVAHKFAEKAQAMLETCTDEGQRKNLALIASTAKRIPAAPPSTFYEGLAMLLFTREAFGNMGGIGISHLGHVDRLLGKLYENDIKDGTLTKEDALEFIGKWMVFTDIKFDLEHNSWPETSTCIQLGGCDENGDVVYNEVTKLFITAHNRFKLVNPKLNCRFSKNSPDEYLRLIGQAQLSGDNNFALINDEVIINGLVENHIPLEQARLFVNGGCQETMIEGAGHTQGANTYVSIMKVFELSLQGDNSCQRLVKPIQDEIESFDELYAAFIKNFCNATDVFLEYKNFVRKISYDTYVSPAFSATQKGCIQNGRDYAMGGCDNDFVTVCLTGIGTLADSLYAIKHVVFDRKLISFAEMKSALKNNWEGYEDLRQYILKLPKYGMGNEEVDGFAKMFVDDTTKYFDAKRTAYGGKYIISLFVYFYYYRSFAPNVGATPDGRKAADLLNPGISPSQLAPIKDCVTPLASIKNVDYCVLKGGNAVFDVMLPVSPNLTPEVFAAYIKTCIAYGCPTIQPNIVSVDALKAAKESPENYKQLIVRICGLSAYFVALGPAVQDEIINRHLTQIVK